MFEEELVASHRCLFTRTTALLDVTGREDIVLDRFLGSGSLDAEKTGRRSRAINLDPLYVDVVVRRYEAATGRPPVLEKNLFCGSEGG